MALTKCFECGREISELAATCPGCGAPGPAAEGRAPESADVSAGGPFDAARSASLDPAAPPSPDPARPSPDPARPSPDPAARPSPDPATRPSPESATPPASDQPGPSLDEIRDQWRAERTAAGFDDAPAERRPDAFGFGQSLGEKWSARKVLYIVVGITLVAALIRPALATIAILAGVAYWTADKLLAPGGRAADAPEGSGFRTAHAFWVRIGVVGRLGVALVVGVLLGLLTGTL